MEIKCVAIDDEPPALDLIKEYASRLPVLKLIQAFDDAVVAAEFIRSTNVDLIFLDINMPDITGIELAKSFTEKPLIIFTTAHKSFAFEGFELQAVDYLLKPIEFERFSKAVNKTLEYLNYKKMKVSEDQKAFFVRSEYQLIKINLEEIEYIESLEDYMKINLSVGKPVMTLMTMKALLEKLPSAKFIRIHRSYVVPVSKIKSFANKKIKLTSAELPVSDSYFDIVKASLKAR